MSKVTGQVVSLTPLPCLGKACAIYAQCRHAPNPLESAVAKMENALAVAHAGKSLPMVGAFFTVVESKITDMLDSARKKLAAYNTAPGANA